jgi:hypothetical protein
MFNKLGTTKRDFPDDGQCGVERAVYSKVEKMGLSSHGAKAVSSNFDSKQTTRRLLATLTSIIKYQIWKF